jgi:hypothetical protein
MSHLFIYAQFEDGSVFHLKDAKIRYHPNQILVNHIGADPYVGISKSDRLTFPFLLDPKYKCLPGQEQYTLTFQNLLNGKFVDEPFYVGDIEFHLVSYSEDGYNVAAGKKK